MNNKLHLYTGDGKGKTTAAMGLALRSLGHGNKVLVAQFMKTGNSGELTALKKLGATVLTAEPVKGFTFRMDEAQKALTRSQQTAFAQAVTEAIRQARPDTIVLDELGVALTTGMLEEAAARALIEAALESGETAATGRTAPAWLEDRADYLSRVRAEKHPYASEGLPARKGVEW